MAGVDQTNGRTDERVGGWTKMQEYTITKVKQAFYTISSMPNLSKK